MPPKEPHPLTNACCKADWANGHLDKLRVALHEFCADSHTSTREEEPERDQVRYRIYTKAPHVSIYLICGDYLQCLRTALDHAVWSLINHRTGIDSDSSEFPIFDKEPLTTDERKRFDRKIDGLSTAAVDYVKSIQPYNRPAGMPLSASPLWCLHQLNRIDKHRGISVLPHFSEAIRHHFGMSPPSADFADMFREPADYGYDVVCRGAYKHLKPEIITLVLFGEGNAILNFDELAQLYNFVTDEVLVALASRVK